MSAESLCPDSLSWRCLIDRVAGPLRLEPPARRAYGQLATLHLVASIWGEIALLRAAERLVRRHHVSLAELLDGPVPAIDPAWFGAFLAHLASEEPLLPVPPALLRPAAPRLAP